MATPRYSLRGLRVNPKTGRWEQADDDDLPSDPFNVRTYAGENGTPDTLTGEAGQAAAFRLRGAQKPDDPYYADIFADTDRRFKESLESGTSLATRQAILRGTATSGGFDTHLQRNVIDPLTSAYRGDVGRLEAQRSQQRQQNLADAISQAANIGQQQFGQGQQQATFLEDAYRFDTDTGLQKGALMGEYEGAPTLAGRSQSMAERGQIFSQNLALAQQLGFYTDPTTGATTVTLGGRQMNLSEATQQLENALARAQATGDFTDPETGETVQSLQSKLAYAQQLGALDGQRTLAGQQMDLALQEYQEGVRRFNETFGLDERQFGEARRQFDEQTAQRESEFARSFGLDERQFAEARRQFDEQTAQRESEFARSLGLDERQFAEAQAQFDELQALREGEAVGRFEGENTVERDHLQVLRDQFALSRERFDAENMRETWRGILELAGSLGVGENIRNLIDRGFDALFGGGDGEGNDNGTITSDLLRTGRTVFSSNGNDFLDLDGDGVADLIMSSGARLTGQTARTMFTDSMGNAFLDFNADGVADAIRPAGGAAATTGAGGISLGTAASIAGPAASVAILGWIAYSMATSGPKYTTPDGRTFRDFGQYQQALNEIYPARQPIPDPTPLPGELPAAARMRLESYPGDALIARFVALEGQRRGADSATWHNTNWGREWKTAYEELKRRGLANPDDLINKDMNDAQKQDLRDYLERIGIAEPREREPTEAPDEFHERTADFLRMNLSRYPSDEERRQAIRDYWGNRTPALTDEDVNWILERATGDRRRRTSPHGVTPPLQGSQPPDTGSPPPATRPALGGATPRPQPGLAPNGTVTEQMRTWANNNVDEARALVAELMGVPVENVTQRSGDILAQFLAERGYGFAEA